VGVVEVMWMTNKENVTHLRVNHSRCSVTADIKLLHISKQQADYTTVATQHVEQ
jgi:hypothetical protein